MQFFLLVCTLASAISATPMDFSREDGSLTARAAPKDWYIQTRGLAKRNCGLGMYPPPTVGPIGDGIKSIGKEQKLCAPAKQCKDISCSYGTGVSLCNDGDKELCLSGKEASDEVKKMTEECGYPTDCNDDDDVCSTVIEAMQVFKKGKDGDYNIIVKGGFESC